MYPVRTSAKAIIIKNGKLLVLENEDKTGTWYNLPGGGQEQGETLPETLRRECLEEIGTTVEVGPLRYIRDYIGANHVFAFRDSGVHQIEFMFFCGVPEDYEPMSGQGPDTLQTGVSWMPLDSFFEARFHPGILIGCLLKGSDDSCPVYLGDTN